MVSGVPFLFLILNVWNGQVSMKDGKILNFHKFSLAWSNIWCYNLKQQYIKVSVEAKAGWEPSWLFVTFQFLYIINKLAEFITSKMMYQVE